MTDHYAEALEHLRTVADIRELLRREYETRPKDPIAIARLEQAKRDTFTEAKLHTNLAAVQQARAQVQALEDLRGEIAVLAQDLKGEPEPVRLLDGTVIPLDGRCSACVQEHRSTCPHRAFPSRSGIDAAARADS